jgi:hypothetical protein
VSLYKSFPPAAGMLRTASDASTPRGSASCADPRGVLLPCFKAPFYKELFVGRSERSLQLHVILLPHCTLQASCYCNHSIVQLAVAACCCWHREPQWRLEEANIEIFILQGSSYSLCKALVQSPSAFMSGSNSVLSGNHCCSLESSKNQGKS